MSILDDLKAAVRAKSTAPTRGQRLYELNRWLGDERAKLAQEYQRRRDEIEAEDEPTIEEQYSPEVLDLVAQAVAHGESRTNIRRALGKKTLDEADEVIALARDTSGGYNLTPDGTVHAKGWPMYTVTLVSTGGSHSGVYLVTSPKTQAVERRHLRISPSPAGSDEILDAVWESGAAEEIFARGKEQ